MMSKEAAGVIDSADPQSGLVSPRLTVARKIEATMGAFFAFVVSFVLLLCGLFVIPSTDSSIWIARAIWGVLMISEAFFLMKLKDALEHATYPFAPRFALRFGRMPLPLRPLVALWWVAHFALVVGGCMLVENLIVVKAGTWDVRILRCLTFILVSFTVAYSANLHALLTFTALGAGEMMVYRIWRMRVLLDLCVAVIAVAFPFFRRTG